LISKIESYLPDKAFGFCESEAGRFYFHADAFDRGEWPHVMAIPGEPVEIEGITERREGICAKVRRVRRISEPVLAKGIVRSFDAKAGWGFAEYGEEAKVCFLHTSDFIQPMVVSAGMTVLFFVGHKRGRPRACYVKLIDPHEEVG